MSFVSGFAVTKEGPQRITLKLGEEHHKLAQVALQRALLQGMNEITPLQARRRAHGTVCSDVFAHLAGSSY